MTRSPPRNLLVPFARDRVRDFASATGYELRVAKVLQTLLTEGDTPQGSGEVPWRTAFGSGLHLLRHRNADAVLAELARVRARDALRRWAPSAEVVRVETSAESSELLVVIRAEGREREIRVRHPSKG